MNETNNGIFPPDRLNYSKTKSDKTQKQEKKKKSKKSEEYIYHISMDLTGFLHKLYTDNLRMAEELGRYHATSSEPEQDIIVNVDEPEGE